MENSEKTLDVSGLWPDFSLVPSIETASGLSASFVTFLIALSVIFLIIIFISSLNAHRRIKWLTTLLNQESEDTVFHNRNNLIDKAGKRKGIEAHLWHEFDETLIEVEDGDHHKLCNVYDADHFFNASSLAPGITESRLIAAVPGFLTAVGVIGTFVGLQLGLSELNIGNDVAVDEMKEGLAQVISGAKIAFMTSVWGVLLSVGFNFIEKLLENRVRTRIGKLQDVIDAIFPRLTAEMQLKRIADDGGQSREALQGLAEKIGKTMQESLIDVTTGIQQSIEQSLKDVMGSAMDRLAKDASNGSQRALEQLIESFMDKFSQQGSEQRDSMNQASKGVSDAVDSMNQALNGFISNLNQNQQAASDREQGLIHHISKQVDELVERTSESQKAVNEAASTQLENFGELFEKQARTSASLQKNLTQNIKGQIDDMSNHNHQQQQEFVASTQSQIKAIQDALNQHQTASDQREQALISHLNQNQQAASEREQGLIHHISKQVDELVERTSESQKAVNEAASVQLENFGQLFEKQARTAASLQDGLTQDIKEQINGMSDHNRQQQQAFVASTQAQVEAIQDALNQHQAASGEREQELIGHISRQVDSLVSHAQQQAEKITHVTGEQLTSLTELLQHAQQKQSERDNALGLQFENTIAEIKTAMESQIEATQNLLLDSKQLQVDMAGNSQNLQRLASSIHEGATELAQSTTYLREYGVALQQASTKLSTSILSASESTENLASENHKASESVRTVREQIQTAITTMENTVSNLDQMVQLADGSFRALESHQNSYLAALKENIEQLAEQGTQLLSDYAEQANGQTKEHLKIWAQSTNDYAAQMNNAANALSSVVDEIETKVSN